LAAFVGTLGWLGCDSGTPARPEVAAAPSIEAGTEAESLADGSVDGGSVDGGSDAIADAPRDAMDDAEAQPSYAVCADGVDASFGSIYGRMLVPRLLSCGSGSSNCHSTLGAWLTGSQLDFSLDGSAVYAELLGADGGGFPATNVAGDAGGTVLRVAPRDAGASMLYIKLTLTQTDPRYGAGMPLDTPGSVCPETLEAVRQWIDNGAAP
jgi:hypothetical protein